MRTRCGWFVFLLVAASALAQPVDVLLVAPTDAALQPLKSALLHPGHEARAAWELWSGELGGRKVALTRSEGDPLNAVAATTIAVRAHRPRLIVVFGTARPHDPSLHDGDIVVSESFAAFDGMFSPRRELGEGSAPQAWETLEHLQMTAGEKETPAPSFPADGAAKALALSLPAPHGRVIAGVLGSANQINREADRIAWLRARWRTSTEDGESAHVAGCAALLGVPIVGFRVVNGTDADAAEFARKFVEAWR